MIKFFLIACRYMSYACYKKGLKTEMKVTFIIYKVIFITSTAIKMFYILIYIF